MGRHGSFALTAATPSLPGPRGSGTRLAVVIVSWNTRDLLRRCLASLEDHPADAVTTVWVVDNASGDGSVQMVREEFPHVRVLCLDRNVGFSAGNNAALAQADADFVLLLNPDAEVRPQTLDCALATARRHGGPVAVRLLNPDGTLQPSCFRFPAVLRDLAQALWIPRLLPPRLRGKVFLGGYWDHDEEREVDWALGAFLLVPRPALDAAGPLPEDYPLFGEDLAWCHRLRASGFPLLFTPLAEAVHHGNQAAGQNPPEWRVRNTHAAQDRFLRERSGPTTAAIHRGVSLLNYALRATVFSVMGVASPARRRQGAEYRAILHALLTTPSDREA